MARQFYYFAIFIFVILILQEVLMTTMLTIVGQRVYALGSFLTYFFLVSLTQACCSVIILRYCHRRHYIWPFRAGWLCIILLSVQTAVVYEILVNNNLESWYYYSYCAASAANLLLGVSFIVSKSREHFWLKWIGIASIYGNTAQIILFIWYTVFADFQMKAKLGQVNLALSWLMVAVTVLWVMHFVSEVKGNSRSDSPSWLSVVGLMFLSVTISWFTISCGADFYKES